MSLYTFFNVFVYYELVDCISSSQINDRCPPVNARFWSPILLQPLLCTSDTFCVHAYVCVSHALNCTNNYIIKSSLIIRILKVSTSWSSMEQLIKRPKLDPRYARYLPVDSIRSCLVVKLYIYYKVHFQLSWSWVAGDGTGICAATLIKDSLLLSPLVDANKLRFRWFLEFSFKFEMM